MATALDYLRQSSPELPSPPEFSDIFQEHGPFVYRALRYLGVSEGDLDDVFQEVFVVVHRRLSSFEGRSALRTWLYGIAVRVASDHRRSSRIRQTATSVEDPEMKSQRPADGAAEARDLLRKALARLEPSKREVAVLYKIEGFTMQEIATILDVPLQTAYTRWYAANEQLLQFIRRTEGTV